MINPINRLVDGLNSRFSKLENLNHSVQKMADQISEKADVDYCDKILDKFSEYAQITAVKNLKT